MWTARHPGHGIFVGSRCIDYLLMALVEMVLRLTYRVSILLITIRRNTMAVPAIHPGEHLAEELKELGMSAAELARQLRVPTNRVTEILNGGPASTGDTALRLAHFFGTTPEFWLNLQTLFELRIAEKKVGKSIRNLRTLKHLEQARA